MTDATQALLPVTPEAVDMLAAEQFCKAHGWPITFYPADELRAVPGQFTPSAFVASVTGVDNVCERSAVKASGGMLLLPKTAGGGVTLALAVRPFAPDWRTEQ